ncbi:MAG TPA: TrpB-like pyridoxal phosphate-dependent enzyme [Thermoanaerobaculia bacterium]
MRERHAVARVPSGWWNFLHDFPEYAERSHLGLPSLGNKAGQRISVVPQQPLSLARQSSNLSDPLIEIPERLRDLLRQYRPTPLRRAVHLEERLDVNARLYYKFEGANISGSHKLNTALAQAYYYREAGVERLVTGTGAGQWGSALAYACNLLGLRCTVFMVGASLRQKPQRPVMMQLFGAEVFSSPSDVTEVGREAARKDPQRIGTLAVATGEALEISHREPRTRFAVGSGENCVILHQTLIGAEAVEQMESLGDFPNRVVACMGAGSNFGGIGLPFLRAARERRQELKLVAAEPSACPKLTRGRYAYDLSDFSGTTPVSRMYTLGSRYLAPPIYAGGLRYHGTSPFLSAMYADGRFEATAIDQPEALAAGLLLAETENILPAPESAHAVAAAVNLARHHPKHEEPLVILFNVSGHGLFDLSAYQSFRDGTVDAGRASETAIAESLEELERFNRAIDSQSVPLTAP